MSNATETSAALQPPAATAQAPWPAPTKDAAKHPERQNPQNPSHAVDGTQIGTANAVAVESPLGTEWYAGLSPKVQQYIQQRNPQTTRDLYAMLLDVVENLGARLGVSSGGAA